MWDRSFENDLLARRKAAALGGGGERIRRQHLAGKKTAGERVSLLFDPGSFRETGMLMGDGVITGVGRIDGRTVCAAIQDFTVKGGTLGEVHSRKIRDILDRAISMRVPYISINDSGGARIEEGVRGLDGYSGIFFRNTKASGLIPQISLVLGPCAGGASYSPAIMDFVIMSRQSASMFVTGPGIVKEAIGEEISAKELGGSSVHSEKSGVAHLIFEDDASSIAGLKKLLSYLPQNCAELPPKAVWQEVYISAGEHAAKSWYNDETLEEIIPEDSKRGYDVRRVVEFLADRDSFFELQPDFAKNMVTGFARIDGDVIGVVANNPSHCGGVIDIGASCKAARFIRFCDCFHIPLLTLADVPGFLPGREQEMNGIIRHGAKLLYAYSEATVPKVTFILRKAYGGAYIAMCSKSLGADYVFALPVAEIAVMGASGAVDIVGRKEIENAADPAAERERLRAEFRAENMNPYGAASDGAVDDVILPREARRRIGEAFISLKNKEAEAVCFRKKHGNIPL